MEKQNTGVFLKVVELGSFKKAADALGYTQAGISYIINAMEEELGVKLFMREYGGVQLTTEGKALLPLMKQINNGCRLLKEKVNDLKNLKDGTIRILSMSSTMIYWLPSIIRRFHDDYPDIHLDLTLCESRDEAEEILYSHEADCGFLTLPVKKALHIEPLLEEPMMAVFSPEHPASRLRKFPIADIGRYPFISTPYDQHTELYDFFKEQNASPNTSFTTDNDYAVLAMVSQNLGYCIFPRLMLENVPFPLKCLEFDEPVNRTICLGTRSLGECSNATLEFIQYTKVWVSEHYR